MSASGLASPGLLSHRLLLSSPVFPIRDSQWMEEALVELGVPVMLTFAEDGSGKGAAVTAVVASSASK